MVRVAARIDELAKDPRPARAVKLAGAEDLWRVRVGDCRMVYQVRDKLLQVLVVLVGRRGDIYRRLRDL
jgi:mRNA interferase RelE/StbE